MSADTKMKEAARQREKELHDHASWMEDGIMMGREQGKKETLAKVIEQLKLRGVSEEEINNIVGAMA